MKRSDWVLLILQVLMWVSLVNAGVFLLIAIGGTVNTTMFLQRSVRTTGTVTALEEHTDDDDGSVTFSPVFTFVAADGSKQVVHSYSSSNPSGFEVGESVPVLYERNDPSNAGIATFWQTWPLAMGFAIASFLLCLVGLFFRWRIKKRRMKPPALKKIQSLEQI